MRFLNTNYNWQLVVRECAIFVSCGMKKKGDG